MYALINVFMYVFSRCGYSRISRDSFVYDTPYLVKSIKKKKKEKKKRVYSFTFDGFNLVATLYLLDPDLWK